MIWKTAIYQVVISNPEIRRRYATVHFPMSSLKEVKFEERKRRIVELPILTGVLNLSMSTE